MTDGRGCVGCKNPIAQKRVPIKVDKEKFVDIYFPQRSRRNVSGLMKIQFSVVARYGEG